NYDLTFWYTMKNDMPDPWAIVSIVGVTQFGPIESQQNAIDGTISSLTVNDISDPATYVEEKLSFNSGDNNEVAIYFYNDANVEARFDDFSIEVGLPGAVAPSAGFDSEQSSTDYLEYTFTNTSTNAISYSWDFGDGNTSTDESPTHVYATADVYTVTLEVTSADNLTGSLSKTVDIQAPVTADFTFVTNQNPDSYQTVQFMDASVGAVELLWEFGDGYQFTGMNPEHTYMVDDIYTVTLTATSITGLQDVTTMDVTVALGFIASINDPGVEDGTGAWRNNALEDDADMVFGDGSWVTQSSSTNHMGAKSAKLPTIESNGGDQFSTRRWIYQAIEVEANTDYDIDFFVRNKDSNAGTTVTVQIYDAPFDLVSVIDDSNFILAEETLNAASGHDSNSWTEAKINFNSGSSTMIVLYIYNDWTLNVGGGDSESESYFDTFSITKL
ncbi:MAG: PKD domain-containing protein, partial [Saprospiraceae bacterium]